MIRMYNEDCMNAMIVMPDDAYDLAIVDPPYGINKDGQKRSSGGHGGRKGYEFMGWDSEIPSEAYFKELFRVSKNQIIWGGNYFARYLPSTMGWVLWDKGQRIIQSDGELAFTSFNRALRVVTINRVELLKDGTFHPTQKPVKLYKWLLKNYATQGDKILDTHGGSGSIAIACHDMGYSLDMYELNTTYYTQACERINRHASQERVLI